MRRISEVTIGCIALALAAVAPAEEPQAATAPSMDQQGMHRFLASYCVECHDQQKTKGEVRLDDLDAITDDTVPVWDDVRDMLAGGAMPPKSATKRPAREEQQQVVTWLEATLERRRAQQLDTGGDTVIRRINHRAYRTMIQSLLGVPAQGTEAFPVDVPGDGYDTVGSGLVITADLYDRYLDSALRTLDFALPTGDRPKAVEKDIVTTKSEWTSGIGYANGAVTKALKVLNEHPDQFKAKLQEVIKAKDLRKRLIDDVLAERYGKPAAEVLAAGTDWSADERCVGMIRSGLEHDLEQVKRLRGDVSDFQPMVPDDPMTATHTIELTLAAPGWYELSADLCASDPRYPLPARFVADDRVVREFMVWDPPSAGRQYTARVFLDRGWHRLLVDQGFPSSHDGGGEFTAQWVQAVHHLNYKIGRLRFDHRDELKEAIAIASSWTFMFTAYNGTSPITLLRRFAVRGPVADATPPAASAIFTRGIEAEPSEDYAREIVTAFMRRIYAGACDEDDARAYTDLVMSHYRAEHDFVAAVKYALAAMLSSPRFLYLEERQRGDAAKRRTLSGRELARRLAYALWSDLPDSSLIASAESGALLEPAELLA